jgi:2-keto-4-pentenoate hydratase
VPYKKAYGRVEVELHLILTSAVDGSEWSYLDALGAGKEAPVTTK